LRHDLFQGVPGSRPLVSRMEGKETVMVIYTDIGFAPIPEGWSLERAVEVLRWAGHTVLRIEVNGKDVALPEQAA